MLGVTKDELNGYRKTIFQEYLYQVLLKEWQTVNSSIDISHFTIKNKFCTLDLREFHLNLTSLIIEVLLDIILDKEEVRERSIV